MTLILVLFITKLEYSDVIKKSIILWSGQKKRTDMDSIVKDTKNTIHIWYRERKNTKFIYKGQVSCINIENERNNDEPLKLKFKLHKKSLINDCPIGTKADIIDGKRKCYKRDCFTKLNLQPKEEGKGSNFRSGIMFGIHNRL